MARGMANGEGVVSQAQTQAWDEGCDRIGLGKSPSAKERGTWIWDPRAGKLVRPWQYDAGNTAQARFAPISTDRYYEGTVVPGTTIDIGSRRKRKAYMKEHGLADADDAKCYQRERAKKFQQIKEKGYIENKERREAMRRELTIIRDMPQAKYDRLMQARQRERTERAERGIE